MSLFLYSLGSIIAGLVLVWLIFWVWELAQKIGLYFWVRSNFPKDWRQRWKSMYYK